VKTGSFYNSTAGYVLVQAISASNDTNRFGTAHVVRFALRERSELRQTSGSSTIAIPLVSILNPEHVLEKVPGVFWMNPYLASSHPAQF
jgi:hypothetical protein